MNEDIERMVQAINREIPQLKGALRLWGQTFTRPYGNLYAVVECIGVGDQLILTFDEGEELSIWQPKDLQSANKALAIRQAQKVRWEWVQSDWPKVPGVTHVLDLYRRGNRIEVMVDTGGIAAKLNPLAYPAFELQ